MLVLSRKHGESIRIHDEIVITVVQLSRGRVQLGIEAPPDVPIHREEVFRRMAETCLVDASSAELRATAM